MRRFFPVALTLALLSAVQLFAFDLPKPSAELKRFQLDSLTLREVTFLFEVAVKNPYPVPIVLDGMSLIFSVEGNKVLELASQGGFKVPARGERSNSFTATLPYEGLFKVVKDYASKDWLLTTIAGKLVIPIPRVPGFSGLPKSVSFDYKLEKRIPALKPRVSLVDFRVEQPSQAQVGAALEKAGRKEDPQRAAGAFKDLLAGRKPAKEVIDPADIDVPLAVSFTIELRNDSRASLALDSLSYDLAINGSKLVSGITNEVSREGPRTFIKVRNEFSSKRLSDDVRRLFSDRGGAFSVAGRASIKLPDEIRKEPVPLAFDEAGNFSLR